MAVKRKISITEALAALKEHNLDVVVKPSLIEVKESIEAKGVKPTTRKVGNTALTIALHSQHTIGKGGSLTTGSEGERTVEENSYSTYGPGVVTVPVTIAAQLLHQDQLAKAADERFLDRRERSYLIVKRIRNDGSIVHAGVQVGNEILNGFSLNLKETMVV